MHKINNNKLREAIGFAVGDKVYKFYDLPDLYAINTYVVEEITLGEFGIDYFKCSNYDTGLYTFMTEDIGTRIFLSFDAAAQALAKELSERIK